MTRKRSKDELKAIHSKKYEKGGSRYEEAQSTKRELDRIANSGKDVKFTKINGWNATPSKQQFEKDNNIATISQSYHSGKWLATTGNRNKTMFRKELDTEKEAKNHIQKYMNSIDGKGDWRQEREFLPRSNAYGEVYIYTPKGLKPGKYDRKVSIFKGHPNLIEPFTKDVWYAKVDGKDGSGFSEHPSKEVAIKKTEVWIKKHPTG